MFVQDTSCLGSNALARPDLNFGPQELVKQLTLELLEWKVNSLDGLHGDKAGLEQPSNLQKTSKDYKKVV